VDFIPRAPVGAWASRRLPTHPTAGGQAPEKRGEASDLPLSFSLFYFWSFLYHSLPPPSRHSVSTSTASGALTMIWGTSPLIKMIFPTSPLPRSVSGKGNEGPRRPRASWSTLIRKTSLFDELQVVPRSAGSLKGDCLKALRIVFHIPGASRKILKKSSFVDKGSSESFGLTIRLLEGAYP
jgi:hypothetical protein